MSESVSFTIPGEPVGKPRQSQRDKWAKRPCVMRYRVWADWARACAIGRRLPPDPDGVHVEAVFPAPKSYSKNRATAIAGQPHRVKPDADNVLKAVMDSLIPQDQKIASASIVKRWVMVGEAPCVRVRIESREGR